MRRVLNKKTGRMENRYTDKEKLAYYQGKVNALKLKIARKKK